MKKDDILVSSGGWECTDVTFYKIINVKNDFITFRQLDQKVVTHEPFPGTRGSGTVIPIDTFSNDKLIRRKIKQSPYSDQSYVVIQDSVYLSAHVWDGTPQFYDFRNI